MDQQHAQEVLTSAVSDIRGMAWITTCPTPEQHQALDTLVGSTEFAPDAVCAMLDLDPGRMWMEVVAAIRADVEASHRLIDELWPGDDEPSDDERSPE